MPGEMIPVIAILAVFGIPLSAIWTHHLRQMAELKVKKGETAGTGVQAELAALRAEVAELRDTTTRFDMSFDAGLARLEQRVDRVEEGRAATTSTSYASSTSIPAEQPLQQVSAGQGR